MKALDEYMESRRGEDVAEASDLEGSEPEESEDESELDDGGDESPGFRQVRSTAQDYATRQERRDILNTPLSEEDEDVQDLPTELPVASLTIKDKTDDGEILGTVRSKASIRSGASVSSHGTEDDGPQDGPKRSTPALRSLVSSALEKERRQNAKHHNKRGATKVGRAKGHKGKQNLRVKVDSSGVWD
ncbi:hypothetical protein RSAG8_06064, partial [Rhizoctonia solani AG-8 WAC10335]